MKFSAIAALYLLIVRNASFWFLPQANAIYILMYGNNCRMELFCSHIANKVMHLFDRYKLQLIMSAKVTSIFNQISLENTEVFVVPFKYLSLILWEYIRHTYRKMWQRKSLLLGGLDFYAVIFKRNSNTVHFLTNGITQLTFKTFSALAMNVYTKSYSL